nr:hypothetical protein [Pandoravirus massiliensis]
MPREPPRAGAQRAKPIESTALLTMASRGPRRSSTARPTFSTKAAAPRESDLRRGALAARRHRGPAPARRAPTRDPEETVRTDPLPFASQDADDDDSEYDSTSDSLDESGSDSDETNGAVYDCTVEPIDDTDADTGTVMSNGRRRRRGVERVPLAFSLVLPCNPIERCGIDRATDG